MNMRKFQNKDAEEVSALIATTLRCSIVKRMDTFFKCFYMERQNYACLSI